jgi:hypothetical protein
MENAVPYPAGDRVDDTQRQTLKGMEDV